MKNAPKFISIILVFVISMSLCSFAMAVTTTVSPVLPDDSTAVSAPAGITRITVNGDTAVYHVDSDGNTYIRAIDNGGSEYALKHATVVITKAAGSNVSSSDMTLSGSGRVLTATNVNLFNNACTLTISGRNYTLAAGLPNGNVAIDANDPLRVNSVTIGGATGTVTATNVQNPYIGNVEMSGAKWTFINYKVNATMASSPADRSNVTANVAADGTLGGCFNGTAMNLSAGAPVMTVSNDSEMRQYYVFATDPNSFIVDFGFDFTEAKSSVEYAESEEIQTAVAEIESNAASFFSGSVYGQYVVSSGMTVMDVMHAFAEANGYDDEVPEGCTYMATLNGIGEFTFGWASGWMYTNNPSWDSNGAALFENWNTPPIGGADYVLTEGDTICWFICCDYMHHPWN